MFNRKSVSLAIAAALACSASGHAFADASRCSLGHYAPATAEPYRVQYTSDFGDFTVQQGAQLYVPAQPGLTREWLQYDVQRALMSSDCQAPAQHMQIDVVSAGAGFWVLLTVADERESAALVRWASELAAQAAR